MTWRDPIAGLVISYSYLWHSEYAQGREEGVKERPCAIVAVVELQDGVPVVTVLPITHIAPSDAANAVEIPARVKQYLGLDAERSWIVITEWNQFTWPGPDIRRAPGKDDGVYGVLPPALFEQVRKRIAEKVAAKAVAKVRRTAV